MIQPEAKETIDHQRTGDLPRSDIRKKTIKEE
jgi:hypothetical protein